jgi:superfamily II DNA or RNA helicase
MTLRPYQQRAIEKIKQKLQEGVNRQLLKFPTGAGKTCVFSALPDELGFKGRMLVVDHREELTDQALDKLKKWNPGRTVGVEMGSRRCSPSDQIVVASVQTIGRKNSPRLLQFNPDDFDVIVIDEVHRAIGKSYQTVLEHFRVFEDPRRLLLGVTATVHRTDGRGLGEIFQTIVDDISILDAIRAGWLVDLKCLRINSTTNLDRIHTKGGDFDQEELVGAVDTPARNDLAVRAWLEHGQDRQTIVFAVNVQHAKNLAEAFKRYGVAAEAIWGGDPDRKEKLDMHRKGLIRVLISVALLLEGYDDWRVSCIEFARPTQSELLYTQALGRGSRIQNDIGNLVEAKQLGKTILKEDCIVLDVVDVTSKHSLVRLPTLFGMNQEMDLRGKSLSTVMREIDEVKEKYPYVDIAKVTDINSLKTYAEKVDLFKVNFAPEVIQLSEYQWHKTGEDSYVLMLTGGESVCLVSDMLDNWHVRGWVNGVRVEDVRNTFDECIREADARVKVLGGKSLETLIKREEKWHRDEPSLLQLNLCRRLRISVPPGATKGEVHQRLTAEFARRKQERNRERMFAA